MLVSAKEEGTMQLHYNVSLFDHEIDFKKEAGYRLR